MSFIGDADSIVLLDLAPAHTEKVPTLMPMIDEIRLKHYCP